MEAAFLFSFLLVSLLLYPNWRLWPSNQPPSPLPIYKSYNDMFCYMTSTSTPYKLGCCVLWNNTYSRMAWYISHFLITVSHYITSYMGLCDSDWWIGSSLETIYNPVLNVLNMVSVSETRAFETDLLCKCAGEWRNMQSNLRRMSVNYISLPHQ